jgi:hypothetical protein
LSEALHLGDNYIGTEHLLLGLFIDGDAIAATILVEAGASYDIFRVRFAGGATSRNRLGRLVTS